MKKHLLCVVPLAMFCAAVSADMYEPIRYLQLSGGSLNDSLSVFFHLEDSKDQLLNLPAVAVSSEAVYQMVCAESNCGSADVDRVFVAGDKARSAGDSWWVLGIPEITFALEFDARVVRSLPRQIGIAWSDGCGPAAFGEFAPGGVSFRTTGSVVMDVSGQYTGETAEGWFIFALASREE